MAVSLIVLLILLAAPSHGPGAEPSMRCTVLAVLDGDTFVAACATGRVTIRLAEVDAPERDQPFGRQAREHLRRLLERGGGLVTVLPRTRDRYGRLVAAARAAGRELGPAMVAAGMAWHYRRYSRSQRLRALEEAARREGKGLWSRPDPVPPWRWRRRRTRP